VNDTVRGTVLVAAELTSALQAGTYYAFSISVLPGLRLGDPRVFVATMQQINVAIINQWFMASFLGAPLLAAVGIALHLGGRPGLGLTIAAFVFALATAVITMALNVPLNNALMVAGDPTAIADPAAVVARFDAPWMRWNTIRAITSTVAVGCLAWALVLHGRASTEVLSATSVAG
jgi:uncharacterized membrane protein